MDNSSSSIAIKACQRPKTSFHLPIRLAAFLNTDECDEGTAVTMEDCQYVPAAGQGKWRSLAVNPVGLFQGSEGAVTENIRPANCCVYLVLRLKRR